MTTRSKNPKTKAQIFGVLCTRGACSGGGEWVSYLKGLNVNRLLLAIVLPSASPMIIFQKQRPLTSLLTSHHGTSGGQTFAPRPVRQRCTAPCHRGYDARTRIPGIKRDQLLFRVSGLMSQETRFGALFHRQTNTLIMSSSGCGLRRSLVFSPKF